MRRSPPIQLFLIPLLLSVFGIACGDDSSDEDSTSTDFTVPDAYAFESRFIEGESSVSYSGQVMRQVLIADLKNYIGGLSSDIDTNSFTPAQDGDVVDALDFYFRFDSDADGDTAIALSTDPALEQTTYNDISTDKDLVGKIAGNDAATDHKNWSTEFTGWGDTAIAAYGGSVDSPENLIIAFFETIEEHAINRANGVERTDTDGQRLPVYVTEQGQDLQQLIQKFLLMAVTYSQATDDYLDSGTEGKGLEASNTQDGGDAAYSTLEHQWDEGFGYFGAARDYLAYTDEEIAGAGGRDGWANGYHDTDGDGAIDLRAEYNFPNAGYAAKRDRGALTPTDFSDQAMEAFLTGRAMITSANGELNTEQKNQLEEQRDIAVLAWEKTMAANVVHYINATLKMMNAFGTESYSFLEHAAVWSEAKAFALGLQFNPRSSLSNNDFTQFHVLIADAPVLASAEQADIEQYEADLVAARQIIGNAYNFDEASLGDQNGEGGW